MLLDYIIKLVFCFKQKTAYEMRISDWISDVCSSDLSVPLADDAAGRTITLVGERGGPVAASIRHDADGQGFTLARADGKPLQYDRYSLFIGDRKSVV